MGLLKSKDLIIGQEYNIILVIVNKLTKWGYFVAYIEEISVEDIVYIYTKGQFEAVFYGEVVLGG